MSRQFISIKWCRYVVAGILLVAAPSYAANMSVSPGLALRNTSGLFYSRVHLPPFPGGWQGLSELRARPTLTVRGVHVDFGLELETRAGFSTMAGASGGSSVLGNATPLRATSLNIDAVSENNVAISGWIDRADVTLRAGPLDIQIGRQPLSLGTAQFVGVLDWVAPFAPGDLDATFKPGVDAVRIRGFVGGTVELEAIAVFADPVEWSGGIGRSRFQVRRFDLEVVAGRLRERLFAGLGWQGELGVVQFWGEGAVFEHRSELVFGGSDAVAVQAVAGLGYRLPKKITIGVAGLYQDFGVRDPDDLPAFYLAEPAAQGWLFLGSAGYAILTMDAEVTPLVLVTAAGVVNMVDGSTLWQPALQYSVAENTDLSVFAWASSGKMPDTAGTTPVIRSEFGLAPSGFGLYARWFF